MWVPGLTGWLGRDCGLGVVVDLGMALGGGADGYEELSGISDGGWRRMTYERG